MYRGTYLTLYISSEESTNTPVSITADIRTFGSNVVNTYIWKIVYSVHAWCFESGKEKDRRLFLVDAIKRHAEFQLHRRRRFEVLYLQRTATGRKTICVRRELDFRFTHSHTVSMSS